MAVGFACVTSVAALTWQTQPTASAAAGTTVIATTVDPHSPKIGVPRHFGGLSLEYAHVFGAFGSPATTGQTDAPLAQLFRNVTDAGAGAPTLRIGGGSGDESWWNPDGEPRPNGINYDLNQDFVAALRDFRTLTHLPLILVLNMASNRPGIAVDWARAALNGLGRRAIRAFEIGNEPDIYKQRGFGSGKARPSGWGFANYLDELGRFMRRLKGLRSWLPLAAPGACCKRSWDSPGLPRIFDRARGRLSLITYHHYPSCYQGQIALKDMMSDELLAFGVNRLAPDAKIAKRHGLGVRLTETTPNACAEDSRYATALWALDWMYDLVFHGLKGADFHQIGSNPFTVDYVNNPLDPHYEVSAGPLYYAMLMFARATSHGAHLLPEATLNERRGQGANTRVWAAVDGSGDLRVLLLNKGPKGGWAVIKAPGPFRGGSLQRLRGQDPEQRNGVTLAGQSVANPSRTGNLEGGKVVQQIPRGNGGNYRFRLPGFSAALLIVHHKR